MLAIVVRWPGVRREVGMRFLMLNWMDPENPLAGGAERVSSEYMAALVRRGHEVFWFANAFPGCEPETVFRGIRVVRGGRFGASISRARRSGAWPPPAYGAVSLIFRAWRWMRRQPAAFDLLIEQHHGLPWYAPWWAGTRVVACVHEVLGPIWDVYYPWPVAGIGRWLEGWNLRRYRNVPFWAVSRSTEAALRRCGIRDVTHVQNGVGARAVDPLPEKRLAEPLRLAVVSWLKPTKRIDHAIDAVDVLRRQGVDARLAIVGGGQAEASLRARVSQLQLGGAVSFLGRLSEQEKDRVLESSDLLLHTSIREGWGLSVMEANCLGAPAVVYPVPGLVDSTLHEETGIVVRCETPEALAAGVRRMLEDAALYESCRRRAWRRGAALHWDRVTPAACDWLEAQAARRQ